EIEELTAELNASRARIREAFAAQERFLSNISHEFKTPIATLLTEAQTIDRSGLGEEGLEFVELAEDEMRRLGRLVESFLTLTRVRDGAGVTKPKVCPANELVMDSVEDCASMAEQHAVRLVPELADGEDAFDAMLMGDPPLLQTMLNNLVRNAIRFSPREGRVFVTARLTDDRFEIAVRDQGPGLSADLLDHVFDRFVQSSDEVRRERGHGLGLAIAKGIAELHHGDIHVRDPDEGGAEFMVWLPLAHATPDGAIRAPGAGKPEAGTPNGRA
ncbi:MAG: HAMP domain-containing histidine kinase, partial [Phycisphaerales bacterium]|nr:HAMP domain-containing histidine kinase [Phycisphaerales bacterium]